MRSEKRDYVLRLQPGKILAVSLVFVHFEYRSVFYQFFQYLQKAQRCKILLLSQTLNLKLSGCYLRVRNGTERQTSLRKKMKPRCEATKWGLEIIRAGHQALALLGEVERRKLKYRGEFRALVSLYSNCLSDVMISNIVGVFCIGFN